MKKLFLLLSLLFTACQNNPFKEYENNTISVYIEGEILFPGEYVVENDTTLNMLIAKSGGILEEGDLAQYDVTRKLVDGETIIIFKKDENKININIADTKQLQLLNGIGKILANRIIDYRSSNGLFKSIDQIKRVKGINDNLYTKIMDKIKVR